MRSRPGRGEGRFARFGLWLVAWRLVLTYGAGQQARWVFNALGRRSKQGLPVEARLLKVMSLNTANLLYGNCSTV